MAGCIRCGHGEGGEKQSVKRTACDWKCLMVQAHGIGGRQAGSGCYGLLVIIVRYEHSVSVSRNARHSLRVKRQTTKQ